MSSLESQPPDGLSRRTLIAASAIAALALTAAELGGRATSASAAPAWGHPLNPRGVVSSHFRRPERPSHNGIDFDNSFPGSDDGDPIYAIADGQISASGWDSGWGILVRVDHGGGWQSLYAHTRSGSHLAVGTRVARGDHIARIGNTGRSAGPHLHLEIWFNNSPIDPEPLVANAPLPTDQTEDDMFTDADRNRLDAVYAAIFTGGTSMPDRGKSIGESLALIVAALMFGGTSMPDGGKSIAQSLADTKANTAELLNRVPVGGLDVDSLATELTALLGPSLAADLAERLQSSSE